MRVIFDHLPLAPASTPFGLTGVGRWTLNALRNLRLAEPDWTLEGLGVGIGKIAFQGSDIGEATGWNQIWLPRRPFWLAEAMNMVPPLETFVGPLDVMLGTAYITRKTRNAAEIPVIYDLSIVKYPDTHPRQRVWYLTRCLPAVLKRASAVVTLSSSMKDEIAGHFGYDERRIFVAPPGCDPHFFKPSLSGLKRTIEGDYLLAVGTIEPRKNLGTLVEAYRRLRQRRPDAPPLVLVGGMGWRSGSLKRMLEDRTLNETVRWLGYVSEPILVDLYRHAMGFIYPSLYEGFGMPIVEAMAAGCPVITSRGAGTAEAAGEAGLLIDPRSIQDLESALETLIDDSGMRSVMKSKGLARAKDFTWERTARELRRAILSAVK